MRRKLLVGVCVLFGILAILTLSAAFLPAERSDRFRNGRVVIDGKVYGPPPSEEAFDDAAVRNRVSQARSGDLWWQIGHFYCSRKPANPPIPFILRYPPAFLQYISSDLSDYWLRLGKNIDDDAKSSREREADNAWAELGGYPPDMNGDEVSWTLATMEIAEWTLCPDGHPNPYAGKIYRPGTQPVIKGANQPSPGSSYQRFAALASRSGIDLAQHPGYTVDYFNDRAALFCSLLSEGSFNKVSEEVTFPPVQRLTETTRERPRLETAIMRVAASDVCPQNASKEQDWERTNVR